MYPFTFSIRIPHSTLVYRVIGEEFTSISFLGFTIFHFLVLNHGSIRFGFESSINKYKCSFNIALYCIKDLSEHSPKVEACQQKAPRRSLQMLRQIALMSKSKSKLTDKNAIPEHVAVNFYLSF